MSTTRGRNAKASQVHQLITGTNKHYPNGSEELAFGGATRTVSALTQLLQSFVDLRTAVVASQAATRAKVEAERTQAPPLLVVIDEYLAFVRATFGKSPDALADFGLSPRKARTPPTAEKRLTAVAKRKATRVARHTMGKVQKKDVKGAVKVTVTTTPLDGPQPTAAPTAPSGSATPHS
jgi:hypothetical protein